MDQQGRAAAGAVRRRRGAPSRNGSPLAGSPASWLLNIVFGAAPAGPRGSTAGASPRPLGRPGRQGGAIGRGGRRGRHLVSAQRGTRRASGDGMVGKDHRRLPTQPPVHTLHTLTTHILC
ncbi:hypothetical protein Pcinc_029299 [Petrolisthes cinctipes]|uniref:Uncharacterized protein n=1 Tax=Petrolisthes cinctipes TaxID=88211 RepID=A0AAE1F0M0_PETCI|nr:hypothetical protein Pcinc_029299 [Petrolisthes cinctipes]